MSPLTMWPGNSFSVNCTTCWLLRPFFSASVMPSASNSMMLAMKKLPTCIVQLQESQSSRPLDVHARLEQSLSSILTGAEAYKHFAS